MKARLNTAWINGTKHKKDFEPEGWARRVITVMDNLR
jgi:hypothetical protein